MKKVIACVVILFVLSACSREGFQKNEKPQPPQSASSAVSSEQPSVEPQPFATQTKEHNTEQTHILYTILLPAGHANPAADSVNARIEQVVASVSEYFDLSHSKSRLTLTDSVKQNDGVRFSVLYEGTYQNGEMTEPALFAFGLSFRSKDGSQLTVDSLFDAKALAALLHDEQANTVLEQNARIYEQQRTEISQMGVSGLEHRIIAAAPQKELDHLNTLSFYLTNDTLTAIVPLSAEAGYIGYFEIPYVDQGV